MMILVKLARDVTRPISPKKGAFWTGNFLFQGNREIQLGEILQFLDFINIMNAMIRLIRPMADL